jgi:hypothetical protein
MGFQKFGPARRAILALAITALGVVASAPAGPDEAATAKSMETWWSDLETGDAAACRALLKLSARPNEAVPFLKGKLKPLKIDAERVKALLEKLGSDKEDVWKAAFAELEYFDPRLAIDLETLMNEVGDVPARQRMVEVLSGRPAGSLEENPVDLRSVGENGYNFVSQGGSWWAEHRVERLNSEVWVNQKKKWTRAVRAIVLLEQIGTPEAVAILKAMAGGHPEAQPTRVAVEALDRIAGKAR